MNAQHTPGPWIAPSSIRAEGFRTEVEAHTDGRVVALCDPGRGVSQFRITGEEAFANARLIAAAPELADELKATRDRLAVAIGVIDQAKGLVWMGQEAAEAQVAKADALLAKATGAA